MYTCVVVFDAPCAAGAPGLQRGGKMKGEPKVEQMKISEEKKTGTQQELFDFIAQSMADFLKKYNINHKLPLGFTFSFPVAQTSLTSGTLKQWTKDFDAKGAVGRDVVEMLQEALVRRGVSHASLSLSNALFLCLLLLSLCPIYIVTATLSLSLLLLCHHRARM